MQHKKYQASRLAMTLLLISMILSACSGVGDWTVSNFPGGYSVWRINSDKVILCLPRENRSTAATVVETYVFELAFNDDYIFAKRADVPEGGWRYMDKSNPDYYIVTVADRSCSGPLDETAFAEALQALELDEPPEWMNMQTLRRRVG